MKLLSTLVLLFLCGCGPSVISTDSMPSPSPSQTEQIREAITNVARAYFKAGVESALLSQALTPELKGDAATTAAYQCWLSRNTNCPFIKTPKIEYNIVVVNGCEYLSYKLGNETYGLTHKGNCTNIVHGHER